MEMNDTVDEWETATQPKRGQDNFRAIILDVLAGALEAKGVASENVSWVQDISRNTISKNPYKFYVYDIASYLGKQEDFPDEVREAVITLSKMAEYSDKPRDQLGQTVQEIASYLGKQKDVPHRVREAVEVLKKMARPEEQTPKETQIGRCEI